jgi:hypothetical protein
MPTSDKKFFLKSRLSTNRIKKTANPNVDASEVEPTPAALVSIVFNVFATTAWCPPHETLHVTIIQ